MDFADELISEKNFLLEKETNGVKMVIPQWEQTTEDGFPIKAALFQRRRNLPCPPRRKWEQKSKGKGKGKTGGKNPPASQPSSSSASSFRPFHELMRLRQAKKHFLKQTDVCYKFQSRTCSANPCSLTHKCIGCGREGVPYDDCGCAEAEF